MGLTITVANDGAYADGVSLIVATANYTENDHFIGDVHLTFSIVGALNATFEDGTRKMGKKTNSVGDAVVNIKGAKAESGTVVVTMDSNPQTTESRPFNFSDAPTLNLSVVFDNAAPYTGDGLPGEGQANVVEAFISGADKEAKNTIHFEIDTEETAWFVDASDPDVKSQDISRDVIGENVVSVKIADSQDGTALVTADIYYGEDDHSDMKQQPVNFKDPLPDNIELVVSNNLALADGKTYMTAKATTTKKDQAFPGAVVHFSIEDEDVSATFIRSADLTIDDEKLKKATGKTNSKGVITAQFADKIAEKGAITVYFEQGADGTDKPMKSENFEFTSPDGLKLTMIATSLVTGSLTEWVDWGEQVPVGFADGESTIRIQAKLTDKNGEIWPHGTVNFEVDGTANIVDVDGTPHSGTSMDVAVEADGITKPIKIACSKIGSVNLVMKSPPNAGSGQVSLSKQLSFTDPWVDVSSCSIEFAVFGKSHSYIYANGKHVSLVNIYFTPAGPNHNVLTPATNRPYSSDMSPKVKLLFYDDGKEIDSTFKGTDDESDWHVTTSIDPTLRFDTPLFDPPLAATKYEPITSRSPVEPRGNDGATMLGRYVSCTGKKSHTGTDNILGVEIQPSGNKIVADVAVGPNNLPLAKIEKCDPLRYCQNGNGQFEASAQRSIVLLNEIVYNDGDIIASATCDHIGVEEGSINGLADYPDNYWRQWTYKLSLRNKNGVNKLFKAKSVEQDIPPDYCVSQKSNGIYNYKLYIWPMNIIRMNGQAYYYGSSTFPLTSENFPKQIVTLPSAGDGSIFMVLYCVFGNLSSGSSSYYYPSFMFYDQFGNSGRFQLQPDKIPQQYDPEKIPTISWFTATGTPNKKPTSTPGTSLAKLGADDPNGGGTLYVSKDDSITVFDGTGVYLNGGGDDLKFTFSGDFNTGQRSCTIYNQENNKYLSTNDNYPILVYSDNSISWKFIPSWKDSRAFIQLSGGNGLWKIQPGTSDDPDKNIFMISYENTTQYSPLRLWLFT